MLTGPYGPATCVTLLFGKVPFKRLFRHARANLTFTVITVSVAAETQATVRIYDLHKRHSQVGPLACTQERQTEHSTMSEIVPTFPNEVISDFLANLIIPLASTLLEEVGRFHFGSAFAGTAHLRFSAIDITNKLIVRASPSSKVLYELEQALN